MFDYLKYDILDLIKKSKNLILNIDFILKYYFLPIKKNKIVFVNHAGLGYGCNTKYIAEEIIKQNLPYELVWFTKPEFMDKSLFPAKIRLVDFTNRAESLKELATAKVWVDNSGKIQHIKNGLIKKNGQKYINTWHGSFGIKKLDLDIKGFCGNKFLSKDTSITDIYLSNCSFETNMFKSAKKVKSSKIKETGHPRDDILYENSDILKQQIKEKLGISASSRIALYMPTFRGNRGIEAFNIDYNRLKQSLEEKTEENWEVLSRFHPQNLDKIDKLQSIQKDVSLYPDVQELLLVSDVLISDYSSCMFDFLLTRKPCFIYAVDIEDYNTERGFYFPLETTPFPIARNNDELMRNIKNFNVSEYKLCSEEFLSSRDIVFDGKASKKVVEMIKSYING